MKCKLIHVASSSIYDDLVCECNYLWNFINEAKTKNR